MDNRSAATGEGPDNRTLPVPAAVDGRPESRRVADGSVRPLIDANVVGVVVADATGAIIEANDYYLRLIGYTRDELEQGLVDWRAITPPEWLPADEQAIRELRERGACTPYEKEYVRRDGTRVPVFLADAMLPGAGEQIAAFVLDITDRKLAEKNLETRNALLRALINSPRDLVIFSLDRDYCYTAFNDKHRLEMRSVWNADIEVGTSLLAYMTDAGLRELAKASIDRALGGETFTEINYQPGVEIYYEFLWSPVRQPDGGVTGITAFIRDITEHQRAQAAARRLLAEVDLSRQVLLSVVEDEKRAEAALSQLNAELEARVLDRTAELAIANEELDSFAYAVSHDLRAPLRAMIGFSLAMLEDFGERMPVEARAFLEQVRLASQNMGELIDGLLALSRTTRGELWRDRVDLSALAVRVCQELARAEPTRIVQWHVEEGLTAWGDVRMIEVVFRNLLGNAWKYTTGRDAPRVRVYSERDDERLCCAVADNGAGFDMRHADRLFKPFQRLHRQDEFPGIGIGLATVQRVIRRHGGRLSATGVVGEGATFRFWLPSTPEHLEGTS